MIELQQLHKTYQHKGREIVALKEINLKVNAGEIFGVVGQSGAGKSTLIRCVNLLERPTSGRVVVDNKILTELSPNALLQARHDIGMIFQHFNLLSNRTVAGNIALSLELANVKRAQIKHRVNELLALVNLTDKASHYPAQLSGGQKQRVAIARALATNPKVLLSDEATSALDPKTTENILTLLQNINEQFGITILLITHEMEVVKRICHRVALIEHGELVESNSVEQFFSAPSSDLGKSFVAQIQSMPLPAQYQEKLQPAGRCPIIKLAFHGNSIDSPVISTLSRNFSLDISIIQAKIEHIRQSNIGLLLAEIDGEAQDIENALDYLKQLPIHSEVIGYVR